MFLCFLPSKAISDVIDLREHLREKGIDFTKNPGFYSRYIDKEQGVWFIKPLPGCDLKVKKTSDEVEESRVFSGGNSEMEGTFSEGVFSRKQTEKMHPTVNQVSFFRRKAYLLSRNRCMEAGFHDCGEELPSNPENIRYDHPIYSDCLVKIRKRGTHPEDMWITVGAYISLSVMASCRIRGVRYRELDDQEVNKSICEKIDRCDQEAKNICEREDIMYCTELDLRNQAIKELYSHHGC